MSNISIWNGKQQPQSMECYNCVLLDTGPQVLEANLFSLLFFVFFFSNSNVRYNCENPKTHVVNIITRHILKLKIKFNYGVNDNIKHIKYLTLHFQLKLDFVNAFSKWIYIFQIQMLLLTNNEKHVKCLINTSTLH